MEHKLHEAIASKRERKKQKHPASYLECGVFYVPTLLVKCDYLPH